MPNQGRAGFDATGDRRIDRQIVRDALGNLYVPEGVDLWLQAANPMLDGRVPDDLIDEDGGAQRVLDLILALCEGVIF